MKIINSVPDYRHHYLSHCDINKYLDALEVEYPNLVQVKIIGRSFEKRILKSIHISASTANGKKESKRRVKSSVICDPSKQSKTLSAVHSDAKQDNKSLTKRKPIILIDGGIHAREWCTISAALHVASQLTENFDTNKHLLDAFDFVIVPIVNCDGYEYSYYHVCIKSFFFTFYSKRERIFKNGSVFFIEKNVA